MVCSSLQTLNLEFEIFMKETISLPHTILATYFYSFIALAMFSFYIDFSSKVFDAKQYF